MKPALIKLMTLALVGFLVTSCGTLSRSPSSDGQAPSQAEKINLRRDRF